MRALSRGERAEIKFHLPEARLEFAGAKADQRLDQFAVDGIAAIAADDHGDARQMHRIEHG